MLSSLARTKTARAVIEAMIDGERDPRALAGLALGAARGKRRQIARALTGTLFDDHHAQLARMHLDQIDFLDARSRPWTTRSPPAWTPSRPPGAWTPTAPPARPRPRRRGPARRGAARGDPRRHRGPGPHDHRRDRPRHDPLPDPRPPRQLGRARPGRPAVRAPRRKPRKGQGDGYLRGFCTQAAAGAAGTDTFLGERHRRIAAKRGPLRARCAVARSILVIIWHLLNDPEARYADLGPGWHHRKTGRDSKIQNCIRQLQALGLDVTLTPAAA